MFRVLGSGFRAWGLEFRACSGSLGLGDLFLAVRVLQ